MNDKVNLILIASGGGTDAFSIMDAYRKGFVTNVNIVGVISTMEGAGCIEKAKSLSVPWTVISRKQAGSGDEFNRLLTKKVKELDCQLIFLVGCIVKIYPIDGIPIYNIHPADPYEFGGKGMYGLKPHQSVISFIAGLILRGRKKTEDRFFTYPTVHEVTDDSTYDSGEHLLRANVEIPKWLIKDYLAEKIDLTQAAEYLQKIVLIYEWKMLPIAVDLAAHKILSKSESRNE